MSILLIIYLTGFAGFETKAIIDYADKDQTTRVLTKGETLAIDTAGAVVWPVQAGVLIKGALSE